MGRKRTTDDIKKHPHRDVLTKRALAEIGQEELVDMIECGRGEDSKLQQMYELMHTNTYRGTGIARLMQLSGISRPELVRKYGEYKADEMKVRLSRALPDLASDIVEDAKSQRHTCGTCKGAGMVITKPTDDPLTGPLEEKCIDCSGRGYHRTVGDIDSRKMMLEVSGLVKKGSGFGVNINMGPGSNVDSFDSLISRANDLMSGGPKTIVANSESVDE